MTELWRLPAERIAALVRGREVSAGEVLQAHLERIEQVDPLVNALPVRLTEQARAEAAALDSGQGNGNGALAGVPIAIKINTAVAGVPNSNGCPGLATTPAATDSWVVAALRRQGAIVVALANAPEFSLRWHTDNPLHGATANPCAPGRVAGGSSGGSAAAVATGMLPLAHGNDQGGSLRHPASCCGVVAIRPTVGLTPPEGISGSYGSRLFGVEGVLSRSVADNWLGLSAILAGRPDRFPAPPPLPSGLEGRRIGVVTRPGGEVDPEVRAAVERAASILADAGARVEFVDPPGIRDLEQVRGTVVYAETQARWHANRALGDEQTTLRSLSYMESYFPAVDLSGYLAALNRLTELTARWHEFAAGFDAIVGPVATEPPFEIGMDTGDVERAHQVIDSMRFVTAMSAVGSPVAVVPVSTGSSGPLGVQIVAPPWHERRCVELAGLIEAAVGVSEPVDPAGIGVR
ncbi:amidase [Amycolatopsis taiwanensis]|uniref:Amidase n=1 Tax=Amycolatopsis taiwanensis TaxID=342230 RepID=A0A9W6QYT7_9PSEU|nr:amidase family protein [Amycolatopsis taiwanensis]GLY65340.1 amidase [Amycolatopsis taiwanensis]